MLDQNDSVAAELHGERVKRAWSTPHIIVSMMADAQTGHGGSHHDGLHSNSTGSVIS